MKSYSSLFIILIFAGVADAQTCGNGVREGAEQCDDGNTASFDGCSAQCTFEQTQRMNQLKLRYITDAVCTANAFGGAIASIAQNNLQSAIDASVGNGSTSILLYFSALADPTGTNNATVQLDLFNASPELPTATYNGHSDVDWWYVIDANDLVAKQFPVYSFGGNISGLALTAGPGSFVLNTDLGTPIAMSTSSLKIRASLGASSIPMSYASGTDRGHLAGENLDPLLQSFASSGGVNASPNGEMCGNVSAQSLATAPVPAQFSTGGAAACGQGYSAVNNSLLDMFVGGCNFNFLTVVTATQPDQVDPNAPVAGAGGPYKLSASTTSHQVDTCRDNSNTVVALSTCLNAAAYSFSFAFSAERVIAKSTIDEIFYGGFQ